MVGIDVFKSLNPGNLPRIEEVALDPLVLAFTAGLTLLTAIAFGVLPALRTTGRDLRDRMGRRAERGVGRAGWQGTLVALETAAAVVLVVGAGLMARTFAVAVGHRAGLRGGSHADRGREPADDPLSGR